MLIREPASTADTLDEVESVPEIEANATRAAVAGWQRAGRALDEVRRHELRQLTDAAALAAVEELLDLLRYLPARSDLSGLVEQQRLFALLRR